MKIDYEGYEVRRTGIPEVWKLTRPDGRWVLLRPSDEWDFAEEEDFFCYINMLIDLEELK